MKGKKEGVHKLSVVFSTLQDIRYIFITFHCIGMRTWEFLMLGTNNLTLDGQELLGMCCLDSE